jgi:CelD/BcsL family acetyltransferase involved in cellulose biosynthesis
MESVRPLWEQWQTHPNADFDFFFTVVNSRANVVDPVVLVIVKNNIPVALAAGRLEKVPLPISFGYLKVSNFEILQLTLIYGGLMGEWDEPGATVFIRHLRQQMRAKHIGAVYCAAMRLDHPMYTAANRIVPFHLRDSVSKNNLHWWSDLPASYETFLKKINAKHRAQLRSKERKLTEYCGGTIQIRIFRTPDEAPLFGTIADKIAQTTYLRGLGGGFSNNEEMRNRLDLAASRGWMQGYVLYANELPCAFWLGTLYRQVFYLEYTGFDSAFKDFAAGQILFIKMIEHLCTAGGIRGIDFGFGDAEYKQRYGDRNWSESDLYLFAATPGMLLANTMRKSAALLRSITEKALQRFDLLSTIKKKWRLSAEKTAHGCNKNIAGDD